MAGHFVVYDLGSMLKQMREAEPYYLRYRGGNPRDCEGVDGAVSTAVVHHQPAIEVAYNIVACFAGR
jgi:hypothetical protein